MSGGGQRGDGEARRRLRNIYDRNKRRVNDMAAARDRGRNNRGGNDRGNNNNSRGGNNNSRGGNSDRNRAPKRFVVSERVTRREGFGSGGRQVTFSRKQQQRGRFADRSVGRNMARSRGDNRDDRDNRRGGGGGRGSGGRFSNRRGDNNSRRGGDNNGGGGRFKGNSSRKLLLKKHQEKKNLKQKGGRNSKPKNGGNSKPMTQEQLDAQLSNFQSGTKGGEGNKREKKERGAKKGDAPVSFEALDAAMEAYNKVA